MKVTLMDYDEFYDELVDKDYLPSRIDYKWMEKNEDFMKEILFAVFNTYQKIGKEDLSHAMLKLYSDIILGTYSHFSKSEE